MAKVDELVKEILSSEEPEVKRLLSTMKGCKSSEVLERLTDQVRQVLQVLGGRVLSTLVQQYIDKAGVGQHLAGVHDYRQRTWQTMVGELRLVRGTRKAASGGLDIPADRQLGLGASHYTPRMQWLVARLSCDGAYACEMGKLHQMLGIQVTPFAAEQIVAVHGRRAVEAEQHEQQAVFERREPLQACAAPADQLVIGIDAAKYRSRESAGEPWKEIKIGSVRPLGSDGQLLAGGIVADMGKEHIGRQLYIEALRRGLRADTHIVAIADGAPMNWNLVAEHFPNCVEILDIYHANEHISTCADALLGEGTSQARRWAKTQRRRLRKGQVARVLKELETQRQRLGRRRPHTHKVLSDNHRYFTTNRHRMAYPHYRTKGYPIGSGFIESACKQIVTARLKGTGMRWRTVGATHIAKLRALSLSKRLYDFIVRPQTTAAA